MMKSLAIPSAILSTLIQPSAVADAAISSPLRSTGSPDYPIHVEPVEYTDAEGAPLNGFIALPDHHRRLRSLTTRRRGLDAIHDDEDDEGDEAVPAVIILHDASGADDYEKQRATILSHDYGFVGFAADVYGPNAPPAGADWATSMPFVEALTENPTLFAQRIQAAVDYVQALEEVDASKVAIIGYCMGGTGVVHYLNMKGEKVDGKDPLAGAVSIHPSLGEGMEPTVDIDIPSLFLTGGADFLTGPEAMATLEDDMKSGTSNASWETVRYSGIGHGFSNWHSERGYDKRTDARSWYSQMAFLQNEFGTKVYATEALPEAQVTEVEYMSGETSLKGYVANPGTGDGELLPLVIILPGEGDGMYEKQRATQMAIDFGYIAFVLDMEGGFEDPSMYLADVQAAVDHVKGLEAEDSCVDPTKIALVGFGSGGSAALLYGMSGEVDESVVAVASFHGAIDEVVNAAESMGLVPAMDKSTSSSEWASGASSGGSSSSGGGWSGSSEPAIITPEESSAEPVTTTSGESDRRMDEGSNKPQMLIQSGADGDDMDDVMKLESILVAMGANYELTRFSSAMGAWANSDGTDYDAHATARSFDQLQTVLVEVFDDDYAMIAGEGQGMAIPHGQGQELGHDDMADHHADDGHDHHHGEDGHDHPEESVTPESSAAASIVTKSVVGMIFATLMSMSTLML